MDENDPQKNVQNMYDIVGYFLKDIVFNLNNCG